MAELTDELVEHKIVIDEYTELNLKIPKFLTPIELKALMVKANKIFNISDVPIAQQSLVNGGRKSRLWDSEKDSSLYRMKKNNTPWSEIEERIGITKQKCHGRISYLKKHGRWNDSLLEKTQEAHGVSRGRGRGFWTEEMDKKLYALIVDGHNTHEQVAKKLGLTAQQCKSRKNYLKTNNRWRK
jgi:hypothetical protein